MNEFDWKTFFDIANEVLGEGSNVTEHSNNWCAWTTFSKLQDDCNYWKRGLPKKGEYTSSHVKDGGVWMQPFNYSDLAHIIIPAKFIWEKFDNNQFLTGEKHQNIKELSRRLSEKGLKHRCTDLILEIKLY